MKFNIIIVIIIIFNIFNNVKSQKTPTACTYNGINYSFASNGSYSSLSTDNQYRFYWNVCGSAVQCGSNSGIAACQIKMGSTAVTNVGNIASGVFKTMNGLPALYYITNSSPCSGGVYRSFSILLNCGENSNTIATQVYEDSKCTYSVKMTGKQLCSSQTPTPTVAPTETPVTPMVSCQNYNGQLIINSTSPIVCQGQGQTKCTTSNGDTCSTNDNNSQIQCSTKSSMVCNGNVIQCQTSGFMCSINMTRNNYLQVNGININSNTFNSNNQIEDSPSPSSSSSSSSSSLTIISSLFIFSLIISFIF